MLKLKKGVDILGKVGGVKTIAQAKELFKEKLDKKHFARLAKIKNEEALLKIANAIAMCEPDEVYISTGSPADMRAVKKMSIAKGEEKPLAMKGHTIHFDLPEEQGRIVDRTYYIVNPGEPTSVLGNKMPRREALAYVEKYMTGIMKGKTMFVGFFSRGPAGAKMALPALEITSSTYVMHSGDMLYRHCYDSFDKQVKKAGYMLTNVHSEGKNRPRDLPNARVFMDRSWLTTFSTFC
ncbi:phosphoenolpyruvate carboxykinase, partial [bacterium]|nr:phosphoenolpyruvate carboxykinase [bacterium]